MDRPSPKRDDGSTLPAVLVAHLRRDVPLILLDLAAVIGAYLVPLVLRFDGAVPTEYWQRFWALVPLIAGVYLAANLGFGLYGRMWRFASVREARRVMGAALTAGAAIVLFTVWPVWEIRPQPLSTVVFGAALSFIALGAIRFQARLFGFRRREAIAGEARVLVIGAGEAGQQLVRDLLRNAALGMLPVAVVDDDPRKVGRVLHGVRIYGPMPAVSWLVERKRIDQVLLAIPSAGADLVRRVVLVCEQSGVKLRVLPSVREIVNGRVSASDIREVKIEDLLGREQVETDLDAVRSIITGKRVLITGAGGSIGSEIAHQVAALAPESLILADHDETHLHDVRQDLAAPHIHSVLVDVRDQQEVRAMFMRYRPHVVFHAAAHKHVPLLESHPKEALMTNILGTANVADAASAADTERFVLISTDKAIRPVSVMGASKWFAEQIIRGLHGGGTTFCAVRFGNVLGSRGSVIPTFFRQIARGGPVTVTDPSMQRYFMSVGEAVQLVLQAAAMAEGGEVFTLDMGKPTVIIDLAKDVIRLFGRVPGKDVEIEFTGARPGEKMIEELSDALEEDLPSAHPSIAVARPPTPDRAALGRAMRELETLGTEGRMEDLAQRMKDLPHETLREEAKTDPTRSTTWTPQTS